MFFFNSFRLKSKQKQILEACENFARLKIYLSRSSYRTPNENKEIFIIFL